MTCKDYKDKSILPNGKCFSFWENKTTWKKTYYVSQLNPNASDDNPGTMEYPFLTIGKAAQVLEPGERVVICSGIYRETVSPLKGGNSQYEMIGYEAAEGEKVIISGAQIWNTDFNISQGWRKGRFPGKSPKDLAAKVWEGYFPKAAFEACNPFAMVNRSSIPWSIGSNTLPQPAAWGNNDEYLMRRGLIFVDGIRLEQVVCPYELWERPGTYFVEDDGMKVHFRLPENDEPHKHIIEFTSRETVFRPNTPCLGYIHIKGIHFEKVGNVFPGRQCGAVSTNCGHHWLIEENTVAHANSVGIDLGSESTFRHFDNYIEGYHIVRKNNITDCGICGICAVPLEGAKMRGMLIERNKLERNCWHNVEYAFENAAIKTHQNVDNLIRDNIVLETKYGAGIWIDYLNENTRLTGNIIAGIEATMFGGIFVEASHEPNLVDNNIVIGIGRIKQNSTKTDGGDTLGGGHGIYEHDCDKIHILNNLINKTEGFAIHLNLGFPERMVDGRGPTGRNHIVEENVIADCFKGILLPNPHNKSVRNIFGRMESDGYFKVQSTNENLNLKAWREYFGWDCEAITAKINVRLDLQKIVLDVIWENILKDKKFEMSLDISQGAYLKDLIEEMFKMEI